MDNLPLQQNPYNDPKKEAFENVVEKEKNADKQPYLDTVFFPFMDKLHWFYYISTIKNMSLDKELIYYFQTDGVEYW